MINYRNKASKEQLLLKGNSGFTLVELMIALAMSGIIVAAVYAAYNVQQKSYYTQGQVVEMQQNIRSALELMTGDIRMAVYDPGNDAGASITTATPTQLSFTMDLNNDGDTADANETVTLDLSDDANNDTLSDSGFGMMQRNNQSIAENINALEFYYTLEDGSNIANANTVALRDNIQSVHISILAKAEQRDAKYTNNASYTRRSGAVWNGFNDNFRRRMLTATVYIRNRGLN